MQECTSNLITDFDFELLTESFVNVHLENFFGGNCAPTRNLLVEIILQYLVELQVDTKDIDNILVIRTM